MLKRLVFLLLIAVVVLVAVLGFNTFTFHSKQKYVEAAAPPRVTDSALLHLQQAIQFQTISASPSVNDPAIEYDSMYFGAFHQWLRKTYPRTHQLQLEEFTFESLLFKWEGADTTLNPFVLMAHQDVVPIEHATQHMWTVDPFGGVIKDQWIWGRGSADDKINMIGILETVEKLLSEGFVPKRTIYLAFGHDEEVGGYGARAMAAYLKAKGVTADLVLDEGGIITLDKVPGMTKPVALLGTAEKGYLTLTLTVEKQGGHSSMPEPETAMDILSKALVSIHEHPFQAGFSKPTEGFAEHIGPEMPFFQKMVFANRWLFEPVVVSIYEKSPGGNALVRTTSAPTIFHSGVKDNIIPSQATASVNFRLLPGDDSEEVIAKVSELIGDERVKVVANKDFLAEPSAVTPDDGFAFNLVAETVHKTWPKTIVTPFLMIGGTDSRHMEIISTQIIKFSPMTDPFGFHGIDERVSIKSYGETMWFFENLLRTNGVN